VSKFERENGVAARIYVSDDVILDFDEKVAKLPSLSPTQLEALQQLVTPVWDGNLISKKARGELCQMGLVSRWNGINFCTQDGYCVLDTIGFLRDQDKFVGGKPWKERTK
jgi:hypothetical protein